MPRLQQKTAPHSEPGLLFYCGITARLFPQNSIVIPRFSHPSNATDHACCFINVFQGKGMSYMARYGKPKPGNLQASVLHNHVLGHDDFLHCSCPCGPRMREEHFERLAKRRVPPRKSALFLFEIRTSKILHGKARSIGIVSLRQVLDFILEIS